MQKTPRSLRLQIGVFGRRNVGKSSLINAITGQNVSIVSHVPGTTTDPVEKAMELLPIGPVLFIDTAGLDDVGALGEERILRSRKIMERADVAVLVAFAPEWGEHEEQLIKTFTAQSVPTVVVFNKCDLVQPSAAQVKTIEAQGVPVLCTVASNTERLAGFREALMRVTPESFLVSQTIIGDLVQPGELVVLVIPIDTEAPKGRLIMPQVQTIRDALDHDVMCLMVKERELRAAFDSLKHAPGLVVTDSQVFLKVAADTPVTVPMTSFSVLFGRLKGDLATFVQGTNAVDSLQDGDPVLIAEGCTHHPIGDDIGRVKLPRWIAQYTGRRLEFNTVQGHDFPDDLERYKLVIHCGSCTLNRRELLYRMAQCQDVGVPITNYGLMIAKTLGILERALSPFPGIDVTPAGGRLRQPGQDSV